MGAVGVYAREVMDLALGEHGQRAPILLLQVQHLQHRYAAGEPDVVRVFSELGVEPFSTDGSPRPVPQVYDELEKRLGGVTFTPQYDKYVEVLLSRSSPKIQRQG